MRAAKFKRRKAVLIGDQAAVGRFVEIDQAALDIEINYSRNRRIIADDQSMRFARRFLNERAGPRGPIMLKVAPLAVYGVTAHDADVIMDAEHRTWQSLQQRREAPGCDIEPQRLDPDTFAVGNPNPGIARVGVDDVVAALPGIGFEAVGGVVEVNDRHGICS